MGPVTVVVDALATARLTRLLTTDRVTRKVRAYAEEHASRDLAYFVGCDWCSSIWIGAGVVALRRVVPRAWDPVAQALACSEVAGVIASAT